ncbi:MAG: S41 family peptidase [Victivallales bacterium]|nr:S41 family peptidase [Victivallales bacterium]
MTIRGFRLTAGVLGLVTTVGTAVIAAPAAPLRLDIETIDTNGRTITAVPRPEPAAALTELIGQLQQHAPNLLPRSPAETDRILQGFLNGFQAGLILTRTPAAATPTDVAAPSSYAPVRLEQNRILYLRLDGLTQPIVTAAATQLRAAEAEAAIHAIVLDLRHCRGYHFDNAVYLLSLICPPSQVPLYRAGNKPPRATQKLVAVLLGPETSGSAEFLIQHLNDTKTGLTLGADTAGNPFPRRTIPLSSGRFLSLPAIPSGFRYHASGAATPLISAPPHPVADFRRPAATEIKRDPCLQRACDLAISLVELHRK